MDSHDTKVSRGADDGYMNDEVLATHQVRRLVETIESQLDELQELFQRKEREVSVRLQISELERAMKTVTEWILGAGEKLLLSQTEIGDTYETAEEQRRLLEQLELKCMVSNCLVFVSIRYSKSCLCYG